MRVHASVVGEHHGISWGGGGAAGGAAAAAAGAVAVSGGHCTGGYGAHWLLICKVETVLDFLSLEIKSEYHEFILFFFIIIIFFFLRDFIFKKTLFEKLQLYEL